MRGLKSHQTRVHPERKQQQEKAATGKKEGNRGMKKPCRYGP